MVHPSATHTIEIKRAHTCESESDGADEVGPAIGEAAVPLAVRVGDELLVDPSPSIPVVIAEPLVPVALPTVGTGAPEKPRLPVLLGCENDAALLELDPEAFADDEVVDQEPAIIECARPTAGAPLYA